MPLGSCDFYQGNLGEQNSILCTGIGDLKDPGYFCSSAYRLTRALASSYHPHPALPSPRRRLYEPEVFEGEGCGRG